MKKATFSVLLLLLISMLADAQSWIVRNEKEAFTDARIVSFSLGASGTEGNYNLGFRIPTLVIRFTEEKPELYIDWITEFVSDKTAMVRLRIDDGQLSDELWTLSINHTATFYSGDAFDLLRLLFTAHKLVVRVVPDGIQPLVSEFSLAGLPGAFNAFPELIDLIENTATPEKSDSDFREKLQLMTLGLPPDLRLRAVLTGSSNSVNVRINLDLAPDWFIETFMRYGEEKSVTGDQTKTKNDALTSKILSDSNFSYLDATIINNGNDPIELNPFTDALIFAFSNGQLQARPDPNKLQDYPLKILSQSSVDIQFLVTSPDDKIRLANTAAYLMGFEFGVEQGIARWARLAEWARTPRTKEQIVDRIRQKIEENSKTAKLTMLHGELSLDSAGIEIPLALKISVADSAQEAR
jgi:hypothetical protein